MKDGAGRYIVDANILLRFFLNDHAIQSAAAKDLIQKAAKGTVVLEVPFVTVLETTFTLGRVYKQPRRLIADELLKLLSSPGIRLRAPTWVLDAIEELGSRKSSFGDACIAAEARESTFPIASFDADFDSYPGVQRLNPLENCAVQNV